MQQQTSIKQHILKETAKIHWQALERHFAAGNLLSVDKALDLVEVACMIAEDNRQAVEQWLNNASIQTVSDSQAQLWQANNQCLWAVVIKPWVLVQEA